MSSQGEQHSIQFSKEAQKVLDLIRDTDTSLFVTGKAGTGKSTLLHHICQTFQQEIAILAPTGIAALNIGGDTIHSFFKLKPGYELDEAQNVRFSKSMTDKLKALDCLLIDEISMVRADILDAIDALLKRARKNETAFGGLRVIFFGDLYQLPPTLATDEEELFLKKYSNPYFFSAHLFHSADLFSTPFELKVIELSTVYRQSETDFISSLNAIRNGEAKEDTLHFLNQRLKAEFNPPQDSSYIHLVTTNKMAYEINRRKLSEIKEESIHFYSSTHGKPGKIQPNDNHVEVKVGAQVMFINNDAQKRWVNGSIGKVVAYKKVRSAESPELEDVLFVKLENGKEVEVRRFHWEVSRYVFSKGMLKRENLGYFSQIPLKLAWAVTIHKSQGKSFDKVIIDLGRGSFAHGQTYVALSRCRSLEGLVLKQAIQEEDIIVDRAIIDYCKQA
jgi:ATP-dependent DNA helicase PIF1